MPPKSKKQKLFEQRAKVARDGKIELSISVNRQIEPPESSLLSDDSDFSYDPDVDVLSDPVAVLEHFLEDWVLSLDRDDTISLGLFLVYHLEHTLGIPKTKAAEFSGMMLGKADRTIRQWRAEFTEHGSIPDNKQGKYQRSGILWSSEDLNRRASKYIRENANVKGKPNLTTASFCQWVNVELLPNVSLPPGYPRRVSVETARKWLHEMGFEILTARKGLFFDGHERDDVVEARKVFLDEMAAVGFLHPDHAPTPEAARAFPAVPLASLEMREKTVVFFHDESTFAANDDQCFTWGKKGEHLLRPKSKGAGIMVSDFVEERSGYLALTEEELKEAGQTNPAIQKEARQLLEYGESKEGYWTGDKFMSQMERAVTIAEVKYSREKGWKLVWIFDQSSCHKAMAADALDVNSMNVKPGGKQAIMRDTVWAGRPQRMVFDDGVAKGMKQVLEERGINTQSLVGDQMKLILQNHDDFKNEKPIGLPILLNQEVTRLYSSLNSIQS
jgi:hypothetical protein